jgi:hypothetical protein
LTLHFTAIFSERLLTAALGLHIADEVWNTVDRPCSLTPPVSGTALRGSGTGSISPASPDPARWHKIDLVRVQDRKAPGGWRYYAHLMILGPGYQSESTRVRRAAVPSGRTVGLDRNVSKLAVVSAPLAADGPVLTDYVTVTAEQKTPARTRRPPRRCRTRTEACRRSERSARFGRSRQAETRRPPRRAIAGVPADSC